MKTRILLLVTMLMVVGSLVAGAADWPQWRGPLRDGKSEEKGLLQQWPAEGPKVVWQLKDIGNGFSTPAVVGDMLYVQSNEGMDNEFVQAIDVQKGEKLWSQRLGKVGENQGLPYPGARGTPTVDGNLLYALGSDGDLACLQAKTGEVVWTKNLRKEFGGQPGQWAYAESPLIDGDVLVCTPGGSEATIVALNKRKGDVVWKSPIAEGDQAAYSSIIIVEVDGLKQYVQFLGGGLVGVDANTGKFLWRYAETAQGSPANIPTPVAENDLVYSSTGRGGGGLIQLTVADNQVSAKQVYFSKKLPTAIGGAVLLDGYLYGTTAQAMLCVDFKSGEVKWEERGIGAGSLCFADGRLYQHGENGEVALLEPSPEGYRQKGHLKPADPPQLPPRTFSWAYPVVANGRLYIRNQNCLWCYDISASQ